MYIWSGIIVEGQLNDVKTKAIAAEKKLGVPTLFDFPQHVSVKISFYVPEEKFREAVDFLTDYYSNLTPFSIPVKGIEQDGIIVWVRMGECKELVKIQNDMNRLLGEKFGVPIHEYDTDFKFHSTLFMGDEERAKEFYEEVKTAKVLATLNAEKAGIAVSEEGKTNDFKIIKTIGFQQLR